MISVMGRSSQLSSTLKATVQVVANGNKQLKPPVVGTTKVPVLKNNGEVLSINSMAKHLPTGFTAMKCGPAISTQVRCAHTDLKVPDFTQYRREATKDPQSSNRASHSQRNSFNYMITGAFTVTAAYTTKAVVTTFVTSMSPAADVLALSKIEVDMSAIPEGKSVTFKWRGKPLFIKHRTDETIETEHSVDVGSLRDPQHDTERVSDPKWLVVLGVCTHLGCVPIADAGEYGGYYCPCHGSHYDSSGRIRKGPAPLNLEVPPVTIKDNIIVVG